MPLSTINALSANEAQHVFYEVCHCRQWAQTMCQHRPYHSGEALLQRAREAWRAVGEAGILESTLGHKRIGDLQALREKYNTHTRAEQGQVLQASDEVLTALNQLNNRYYEKFGFIFIVCATGKSASQMLSLVTQRIENSRSEEINNVALEQEKIMAIRLGKLLETP